MPTSSAPQYEPDPHPADGATRRVSVFGRNGRDGRLDRAAADAQWQDAQPTQAVSSRAGFVAARTAAMPAAYAPVESDDSSPTEAIPTSGHGYTATYPTHSKAPATTPTAAQPAPVRLPAPPPRRRTAATPLGVVLVLLASTLLGWGVYTLLVSVDVFALTQGIGSLINRAAAAAFVGGGVLAFVAFIVALVAVARARPKTAALVLLLTSLILPTAATAGGVYYGATVLTENTAAQAQAYAGTIDVEQIDAVITQVESLGVNVPGKEEILNILRAAKGEG
ncbi:hypothetical protein [Actinomyces sp. MRS3W]|uniref:hypothetical protein n=1 Tax=Actinomyces sp. MRS3W TaxID=2800796 RepID=UPI0028FD9DBA|nr:hypothetical protein [Actinomyces sp. MRS3W]MDU0347744.1 hypothetical protein [Actinomyces sp. MRS3W]